MFCTKCGAEISDNAQFCTVCGTTIENISKEQSESETERLERVIKEINGQKPLNKLLDELLSDVKEQPELYATYKTENLDSDINQQKDFYQVSDLLNGENKSSNINNQFDEKNSINMMKKNKNITNKETNEEWLDEDAVREIQSIARKESVEQVSNNHDEMLPDGIPDWLDEIKAEEEEELYRQKFHLFEHPILVTSIVAFLMLISSVAFVLKTFDL